MKLRLSFVCFLFFFLHNVHFAAKLPAQAQELVFPPKVNLFQHSRAVSQGQLYGFPETRIWGWSNNGKVAYSIETIVEGRGGQVIDFVIMDTVTDKTVFELRMDSFDHGEDDGATGEALYRLYRASIINALNTHTIIRGPAAFLPFPINRNNMTYNAGIVDIQYKNDEYGFFDRVVTKYSVTVTANNRTKTISIFTPVRASVTGYVYMCGYFLSPFENRALVVTAEEAWVFEGTELFYRFAGCHLEAGF